jgi:hypothetical protein
MIPAVEAAIPVLVVTFIEVGQCEDIVLGGEYLPIHRVTVTDVSAGIDLPLGSQFDWFCTRLGCRLCSEGLPNGDAHPSVLEAERDAVASHEREGIRFYLQPWHVARDYPQEEPF